MVPLLTFLLSACHVNTDDLVNHKIISEKDWQKGVKEAINKYQSPAENNLLPYFQSANIDYPPKSVALLAFKTERKVELWAKGNRATWSHIKDYPLTAFSGKIGPKLYENDGQIPEGIYKIIRMNPYSIVHLSMMLDYPNAFDRQQGVKEGRKNLGNNIFIHGKALSAGCLAIGDKAIDELFVLVGKVGMDNALVIISPNDLRHKKINPNLIKKPWLSQLYAKIKYKLHQYQI